MTDAINFMPVVYGKLNHLVKSDGVYMLLTGTYTYKGLPGTHECLLRLSTGYAYQIVPDPARGGTAHPIQSARYLETRDQIPVFEIEI